MLGSGGPKGEGALGQGAGTSVFAEAAVNRGVPKTVSVDLPHFLLIGKTVSGNQVARNLRYFLPKLTSG